MNHACYASIAEIEDDDQPAYLTFCNLLTLSLGLIWEDQGNGDWKDMAANGLGVLGSDVFIVIRW